MLTFASTIVSLNVKNDDDDDDDEPYLYKRKCILRERVEFAKVKVLC